MSLNLNTRATLTRRMTDKRPEPVWIEDAKNMRVEVVAPGSVRNTVDGSPRAYPSFTLSWAHGLLGQRESLLAGSRVRLDRGAGFIDPWRGVEFELLSDARLIQTGAVNGWTAPALPVNDLYPYAVGIETQNGEWQFDAAVSLWAADEQETGQGTYDDYAGEARIEDEEMVRLQNVKFYVGEILYRIRTSRVDNESPRVIFEARVTR